MSILKICVIETVIDGMKCIIIILFVMIGERKWNQFIKKHEQSLSVSN